MVLVCIGICKAISNCAAENLGAGRYYAECTQTPLPTSGGRTRQSPDKAHARRYFVKAEENVPKAARTPDLLATRFIKLFGKLFAAEARSKTWSAERHQRLRQRYSARVLEVIRNLMIEQSPGVLPQSLLGRALTYLREQWPKLVRYLENGDWPVSNNWVDDEQEHRPD